MKKIYIAGKISGLPMRDVQTKFTNFERLITTAGYIAINPVELVQEYLYQNHKDQKLTDNQIWKIAMKVCLKELIDCDAILLLNDWQDSQGAMIEAKLACDVGIKILFGTKDLQKRL